MSKFRLNRRDFMQKMTAVAGSTLAGGAVLIPSGEFPVDAQSANQLARNNEGVPTPTAGAWFTRNDPSWIGKLSKPQYKIKFEFNVKKVKMRDGVMLSANIWRPKAEGRYPVIYLHLPYDKSNNNFVIERAKFFVPRGYAVVAIDCRGRYDSDGTHYIYWHTNWKEGGFEGQDVYDAIGWLAQQPWSSGKIGMTGPSYIGYTQWLGAYLRPAGLTTIVPYCSPDDVHDNAIRGGAYMLARHIHTIAVSGTSRTDNDSLSANYGDWLDPNGPICRHLPLRTLDKAMIGKSEQFWQDYLDHPDNDEYWRKSVGDVQAPGEFSAARYPQVDVPAFNITGWYDSLQSGSINNYMGMVRFGPEQLRKKHRLIVGPWTHDAGLRKVGDLDFGPGASGDDLPEELRFGPFFLRPVELRWFDYWLKGIENGIMEEPPVHIFRMGENAWRGEEAWPLSRAQDTKFYFRSSGHANSRYGDGLLTTDPPGEEQADKFVYDPDDPAITHGGTIPPSAADKNSDGPRDQRSIQVRNDVLVYTSAPTDKDIEVTGRIFCKLHAATTAKDTDFTAKLVDVHPNGYAQILREGIIRARYRTTFRKQELITPEKIYEYTIFLWSVSNLFRKGHRIQVEISSSNFPLFGRNLNTGHKVAEDTELQKATQTIYHNSQYPSYIILPVVTST